MNELVMRAARIAMDTKKADFTCLTPEQGMDIIALMMAILTLGYYGLTEQALTYAYILFCLGYKAGQEETVNLDPEIWDI